MKTEQILVFCKPDFSFEFASLSNSKFELKEDMQLSKDSFNEPVTLLLPSSAGLPFQIELPFGDKNKAKKVIPQYVADLYAEVSDKWLFSWNIIPLENEGQKKWIVYGLAFSPKFSPGVLLPGIPCSLAIPDIFVATKLINHESDNNFAISIKSLGNDILAIFSAKNIIRRILGKNSGIPTKPVLMNEKVEEVINCDLISSPEKLTNALTHYQTSHTDFDISEWRNKQKDSLLQTSKLGLGILVITALILYHSFLWIETVLYEKAANRTTVAMSKAFTQIFPTIPVVEPITQTNRATGLIQNRLSESAQVPTVIWQEFLSCVYKSTVLPLQIQHVSAKPTDWSVIAIAADYQSIETFKKQFLALKSVKEVNIKNTRSISTGVHFKLEGKWVK